MAGETSEPVVLTGCYTHGLDSSRRVMIPSIWRPKGAATTLFILPWPLGAPEYLLALPPARWNYMVERLKIGGSLSDENTAKVERAISSEAVRIALDKVGRLCLTEAQALRVGIEREATLVGRLDKFEIWEPKRYEAMANESRKAAANVIKSLVI